MNKQKLASRGRHTKKISSFILTEGSGRFSLEDLTSFFQFYKFLEI